MKIKVYPIQGVPYTKEVSSLGEIAQLLGGSFLGGFFDLETNVLIKVGAEGLNPHFPQFMGVVILAPTNWDSLK
jgi:hypothetical protein